MPAAPSYPAVFEIGIEEFQEVDPDRLPHRARTRASRYLGGGSAAASASCPGAEERGEAHVFAVIDGFRRRSPNPTSIAPARFSTSACISRGPQQRQSKP